MSVGSRRWFVMTMGSPAQTRRQRVGATQPIPVLSRMDRGENSAKVEVEAVGVDVASASGPLSLLCLIGGKAKSCGEECDGQKWKQVVFMGLG